MTLRRPDPSEHAEYYGLYVSQAPEGEILDVLSEEAQETRKLLDKVTPGGEQYRYGPDKWSIREIVGHLIDTEWVFTFRGLSFSRKDPSPLPGFDQDLWVRTAAAHDRPLSALLDEFSAIRTASIALFRGYSDEEWARTGAANDCPFTVRSMPFILAGHELHHRKVLVERYLNQPEVVA